MYISIQTIKPYKMILEVSLFFVLVVVITFIKSGSRYENKESSEEKPQPKYKKLRPGLHNLLM